MYGWDDEDYAPPPSLLDRIGLAQGHRWDDDESMDSHDNVPPPRERSASPELQIRGRGARRA